jgi:hypothetical protein
MSTSGTTPGEDADSAALVAVLLEIERHVAAQGWDQPVRLFALVRTADLLAAEPGLRQELGTGVAHRPEDALTAVEQDGFVSTGDLAADLAPVAWPETVWGCALAVERAFLPREAEDDLPEQLAAAAESVLRHPKRQDLRLVVGVDRSGACHGLGRLRSDPAELLGGASLAPGLNEILAHTLV